MSLTFTLSKRTAFIVAVLPRFVPSCQTLFITVNAYSTDCLFLVNISKFFLAKPYGLNKQTRVIKPKKKGQMKPQQAPNCQIDLVLFDWRNEKWGYLSFPCRSSLDIREGLCCHLPGTLSELDQLYAHPVVKLTHFLPPTHTPEQKEKVSWNRNERTWRLHAYLEG